MCLRRVCQYQPALASMLHTSPRPPTRFMPLHLLSHAQQGPYNKPIEAGILFFHWSGKGIRPNARTSANNCERARMEDRPMRATHRPTTFAIGLGHCRSLAGSCPCDYRQPFAGSVGIRLLGALLQGGGAHDSAPPVHIRCLRTTFARIRRVGASPSGGRVVGWLGGAGAEGCGANGGSRHKVAG